MQRAIRRQLDGQSPPTDCDVFSPAYASPAQSKFVCAASNDGEIAIAGRPVNVRPVKQKQQVSERSVHTVYMYI
jgi:hypothetical protein